MSVTSTTTSPTQTSERARQEAPLTLTTQPPRPLGFLDQLALWGNLGISLFGPLTGALIATTAGSVGLGIAAIVVGCGLGAILLGASAVMGTVTGEPAMVTLRGLVGRRGSVLPTVLNIAQNIGWATMEIIVISTAAVAVVGEAWRWPFVILAGAAATLMAIRPLGSVRLLRKIMVWLVLAASTFLFVQVLLQPPQSIPQDSVVGFWPAVDLAIADGNAYPEVGRLAAGPLAGDPVQAMRKGHVVAGGDAQLPDLADERAIEGRKPSLPNLPVSIRAAMLQGFRHVEQHDVRRMIGHEPIDVLSAKCRRPFVDECADFSFVVCLARCSRHRSLSLQVRLLV